MRAMSSRVPRERQHTQDQGARSPMWRCTVGAMMLLLIGMLPPGHESAVALTQPDLGFPANGLEAFRLPFEPQLQVSTDLRRIAIRPGTLDQHPTGMSVTSFRDRALPAPFASGVLRRNQTQKLHEFLRGVEAGEIAAFGYYRDCHRELHAAQGLKGLDHGVEAPGFDVLLELLV